MELKVLWLFAMVVVCILTNNWCYAAVDISTEEDLEFDRQLKILNKPPVKTIVTDVDDIIDCIDMYKQPAFDHPLLKNHKLQLKPTSFPSEMKKYISKTESPELSFMKEACPSGTVPIKRTTKEDLIRVKSLSEPSPSSNTDKDNRHIVAIMVPASKTRLYGGCGGVAVYNMTIAPDQTSGTNLWIDNGPTNGNFITCGWKVSQALNGDGLTRLFTYWAGDGSKTGCYNTFCPGFVLTNKEANLNAHLDLSSVRGGITYILQVFIFQDRQTGNWWLSLSDKNILIGYWPKEILPRLSDGAGRVVWGGVASSGQNGMSAPMGNGFKPNGLYKDTCHFIHVSYVDDRSATIIPSKSQVGQYVDKSGCYDLHIDGDWGAKDMGYAFMFGGPGGQCGW